MDRVVADGGKYQRTETSNELHDVPITLLTSGDISLWLSSPPIILSVAVSKSLWWRWRGQCALYWGYTYSTEIEGPTRRSKKSAMVVVITEKSWSLMFWEFFYLTSYPPWFWISSLLISLLHCICWRCQLHWSLESGQQVGLSRWSALCKR